MADEIAVSSNIQGNRPSAGAKASLYPIQGRFLVVAVLGSALASALLGSFTVGLAFIVLFFLVASLWRRGEAPALTMCLCIQWFFATCGFIYWQIVGRLPMSYLGWLEAEPADLERAAVLSILGLACIALGIRIAWSFVLSGWTSRVKNRMETSPPTYRAYPLFLLVLLLFLPDLGSPLRGATIAFSAAQIIDALLLFRYVVFLLLLLTILRQRQGYLLGIGAALYIVVPQLASIFANFKEVLFLVVLALATEWRPWADRLRGATQTWKLIAVFGLLASVMMLGILWIGVIRPIYRPAVLTGEIQGAPLDKAWQMVTIAGSSLEDVHWNHSIEQLLSRTHGVENFSYIVERVPETIPYERGLLTRDAIRHSTQPRILFRDKAILGSDSVMVEYYAGIDVAGALESTNVGLGYIPQFYIDYGPWGMMLALVLLGAVIGSAYRVLMLASPSLPLFVASSSVLFIHEFATFETSLAKLLGGLGMTTIVFVVLLKVACPLFHRLLSK